MLVNGKAFFAQLEKSVNLSKIYLPHRAGEILDCEQSLFSSKIRGEERKTSKRASVTVSVTWERDAVSR